VAYGGSDTERDTGFAKIVTIVFESLGVLNKAQPRLLQHQIRMSRSPPKPFRPTLSM
jgi:hypothetical protein